MTTFREDNTQGYTPKQLDALNQRWEQIVTAEGIDEDSVEWKARQERLLREFDTFAPEDRFCGGEGEHSTSLCSGE